MKAVNPATETLIRDYRAHTGSEVEQRLQLAEAAFASWRKTPPAGKSERMSHVAKVLRQRRTELARLITEEMGKPIAEAEAEIDKCAWNCEFYAEQAQAFLQPQEVRSDAGRSFIRYDPLGPVLAVMPWNFPFWQVFRFAAPALMAGNVAVLKHAAARCLALPNPLHRDSA